MAIEVFNRYEKKYMLNAIQYEKLTQAISEYMVVDAYNRDKPFYEICNIYYDTPDNALIRASIEGPVYKEKLRVRSYGTASFDSQVFVELKKKYESVVYKRRMGLTNGQAMDWLCRGKRPGQLGQIGREIQYVLDFYEEVRPMMYLSYERQ